MLSVGSAASRSLRRPLGALGAMMARPFLGPSRRALALVRRTQVERLWMQRGSASAASHADGTPSPPSSSSSTRPTTGRGFDGGSLPPAFRVAPIHGKGFGLLATRRLAQGELIVSEVPALAYNARLDVAEPPESVREGLERKLAEMPGELRDACMDLHDACVKSKDKNIEGIVFSNAFTRESDVFDAALCVVSSRLNHACVPNVEQSWDADLGHVQVFASRVIEEGEELCNYYTDLFLTKDERRKALWERYRFECSCRACAAEGDEVAESDRRRRRLRRLFDGIAAASAASGGRGAAKRGVDSVVEALALMEQEGLLLHCHRKVACRAASELAVRGEAARHAASELAFRGEAARHEARRWLRQALEASRLCHTPEHRDVIWLERRLEEMDASFRPSASFSFMAGLSPAHAAAATAVVAGLALTLLLGR